jgi:hypothetical protein
MDDFTKSQIERGDKANTAFCLALEMLAYLYHEYENGEPCFSVSDGSLHEDDPIGNAIQLGTEEDSIIAILEAFFPNENVKAIDPKTWAKRVEELAP